MTVGVTITYLRRLFSLNKLAQGAVPAAQSCWAGELASVARTRVGAFAQYPETLTHAPRHHTKSPLSPLAVNGLKSEHVQYCYLLRLSMCQL